MENDKWLDLFTTVVFFYLEKLGILVQGLGQGCTVRQASTYLGELKQSHHPRKAHHFAAHDRISFCP